MALLLDTHVWIWTVLEPRRLPTFVRGIIAASPCVSVGSLYEVGHKARLGKWPAVAPYATRLHNLAREQGVELIDIDADIALRAANLEWPHRDPFDRFIAASAIVRGFALVSADVQFDDLKALPDWPGRLW